jgi:hypothetical protein
MITELSSRIPRFSFGRDARSRLFVVLGAVSGLLYIAMYVAQRAIPNDARAAGLALYLITVVGVFVLYVWVLALGRQPLPRGARLAAFGFPVLFNLLWLPVAPLFSSDVFAYILHGHVQVELGANPYLVHSSAVAGSPLGAQLASYGWQPVHPATPYGPVLTHLEAGIGWLAGDRVWLSMLLFKLVAVASGLAVAVVIWLILDRVRGRYATSARWRTCGTRRSWSRWQGRATTTRSWRCWSSAPCCSCSCAGWCPRPFP